MSIKKPLISIFLRNFSMATLVVIMIGYCLGRYTKGIPGLYVLGSEGIQYHSLFQIALLSLINACFEYLLINLPSLKRMNFTKRMIIMILSCGLSNVFFCYIFKWIPAQLLEGWIGFFISFFICLIICIIIMYYKTKQAEKKYNVLLSDAQHRRNMDEHYRNEQY